MTGSQQPRRGLSIWARWANAPPRRRGTFIVVFDRFGVGIGNEILRIPELGDISSC